MASESHDSDTQTIRGLTFSTVSLIISNLFMILRALKYNIFIVLGGSVGETAVISSLTCNEERANRFLRPHYTGYLQ